MRWQPLPARWREIILSDADFHDWPLGERAVIESLQEWARGGRRLTFLACNYNEVIRRHPVGAMAYHLGQHPDLPRLPSGRPFGHSLRHLVHAVGSSSSEPDRCAGVTGTEPSRRVLLQEVLGEWVRNKSAPDFGDHPGAVSPWFVWKSCQPYQAPSVIDNAARVYADWCFHY
jgi:hypothetical protein